ncbi:hypothetical protein AB3N62_10820 [Leptospira sp. WS4.C2]
MKPEEIINTLLKIAELKKINELKDTPKGEPYKRMVLNSKELVICFDGIDNYNQYHQSIRSLFNLNNQITQYFTIQEFEEFFHAYFKELIISKELATKQSFNQFIAKINGLPIKKSIIFRSIYGIELKENRKPYKLGPFTIYNYEKHRHLIEKLTNLHPISLWGFNREFRNLISIEVETKGKTKVSELADELFNKFETFIAFLIGHYLEDQRVSILEPKGAYNDYSIIISDDSVTTPSHLKGPYKPIPIDDKYFTDPKLGTKSLWELLQEGNGTKFKNRILSAIDWFGKACLEKSKQSRFLLYIISIEALFTFSEKTLVSPSIASNIADGIAFVLGKNKESRLFISKRVSALYGVRSAIAHGGNKIVTDEDLNEASYISLGTIRAFLSNKKLMEIKDSEQLNEYIKSKKFS